MNTQNKIYLTHSQIMAYEQQLQYMESTGKKKLSRLLASSPGSGMGRPLDLPIHDLARQFYTDIEQIRYKLRYAVDIDELITSYDDYSTVKIGATVIYEDIDDGEQDSFVILGPDQADPSNGVISYLSPFASAMLGKQVGERFTVGTSGKQYEIKRIEYRPITIPPKILDWDEILNNVVV